MELTHASTQGIPLLVAAPPDPRNAALVIWLPGFGGTKEAAAPHLQLIAQAGFVGVSFDFDQHGARASEPLAQMSARLHGNLRAYFWPMLARTVEDISRVIDWADAEFGPRTGVRIGGISMGGDAAIAAAGQDDRIVQVAAAIATPDWLRPGTSQAVGEADDRAWACYHRHNPLTNLDRYRGRPAFAFHVGENDTIAPACGAHRFLHALREVDPESASRNSIAVHGGLGHAVPPDMLDACRNWLIQDRAATA